MNLHPRIVIAILLLFSFPLMGGDNAISSFTVHGCLRVYNGGYPYQIWVVGTKRHLAVNQSATEVFDMPDELRRMISTESPQCFDQQVCADFIVQAVTPYRKGEMQIVRIIGASRIVITEKGRIVLMKNKL
jgi:hypothetical protein